MKSFAIALRIFLFLTLMTGVIYPLVVTGIARLFFSSKANGSIIFKENRPVGSVLLGQSFDSAPNYFSSRPSAVFYNPMPSGGSNYGLTSQKLKALFEQRKQKFTVDNMPDKQHDIPSEMLFASGSGLDPHISPEGAMLQVDRICEGRHFSKSQKACLNKIIDQLTEPPQFLCLGQKRINVLLLNLETDKIK
jgi:potassium-transporting ATPase KdpC subunit